MPKRFRTHTLLLMVLALVAFSRLWCMTHPRPEAPAAAGAPSPTRGPSP